MSKNYAKGIQLYASGLTCLNRSSEEAQDQRTSSKMCKLFVALLTSIARTTDISDSKLVFSVNTFDGVSEDRVLMSGRHTVCDIFCTNCQNYVGWRYVSDQYSLSSSWHMQKTRSTKKASLFLKELCSIKTKL